MMFKTFALISTLTTERLMTISNLTSLPANTKDSSSMNGRPPSPEKRKWKISARASSKRRDAACVKLVSAVMLESAKSVDKSKLSAEERKKNVLKRRSFKRSKEKLSVLKDADKRKRKRKKRRMLLIIMKKLLKAKSFRKLL